MPERGVLDHPLSHQISEKQFQAMILEAARWFGWTAYFTWNSIHSPSGFPDLVLARRGVIDVQVLFVELKSEHGRLTAEQEKWRDLFMACPGVQWHCWRPRDWEHAMEILR